MARADVNQSRVPAQSGIHPAPAWNLAPAPGTREPSSPANPPALPGKKGLCVRGQGPVPRVRDYTAAGPGARGAGCNQPSRPAAGGDGPTRKGCCPAGTRGRGRPRGPGGTLRAKEGAEVALCPPPPRPPGPLAAAPKPAPRFSARPARSPSGPRAPPRALPALGLGAPDLGSQRRPPPVSPGGGSGRWTRRPRRRERRRRERRRREGHVTLATFLHSHQINNFSVPRPPPAAAAAASASPKPPHTPPANSPLQAGRWGAGPHLEKPRTIKGAAGRRKGEGVANFPGTARRGARGGRGRGGGGVRPARPDRGPRCETAEAATPAPRGLSFSDRKGGSARRLPHSPRKHRPETFPSARTSSADSAPFCLFP